MRGMGNLTRAAYANQRMTLSEKLRQSKKSKRNTMIALRGQSTVACFHHSCFDKGVWRCLTEDVGVWEHATLLFCARGLTLEVRGKGD